VIFINPYFSDCPRRVGDRPSSRPTDASVPAPPSRPAPLSPPSLALPLLSARLPAPHSAPCPTQVVVSVADP
jgi:hypothetical protein